MKFWVIVGLGPNEVEVPCLIFSTKEKALEAMGSPGKDGNYWRAADDELITFFTHYYNGCGECRAFELREVEEGKPFVGFDLD